MGWNPFERKKLGPEVSEQRLSPEQQRLVNIIMPVAQSLAEERQDAIKANLETAPRVLVHPERLEVLLLLGRDVQSTIESYIRVRTDALGDSIYYSTPVSTDSDREKNAWKLPGYSYQMSPEQRIDLARKSAKPVPRVDTQGWKAVY